MIAVDTDVLVRYATRDDESPFERASAFMHTQSRTNPGYLGTVVLVETWWVLHRAYGYSAADAATGADFADAVIVRTSAAAGCEQTVTFDKRAAQRAGMTLLV